MNRKKTSSVAGSILRAAGNESGERSGASPMALSLMLDSLTRSVSEGILGENKQPKHFAIPHAATNDTFSRFWKATDPGGVQAVRYLFPCGIATAIPAGLRKKIVASFRA